MNVLHQISVIIPTYKPGSYLFECLDALQQQTLPPELYEVLIILNGEKDPYKETIEAYLQDLGNHNVKLHIALEKGVSKARNLGMEKALGAYICFMDDDDLISANFLENLHKKAEKNKLTLANVKFFDKTISQQKEDYLGRSFMRAKMTGKHKILSLRSCMSSACAKLIPRNVIRGKRFNINFQIGEDALFMALISDRIDGFNLADSDTIYYRRKRAGSASRKKILLSEELKRSCLLICCYMRIYVSSVRNYNFLFFLSRCLAVLKFLLQRIALKYK